MKTDSKETAWPAVMLQWSPTRREVVWANTPARHLFGLATDGTDGWPAWMNGTEPVPPGWEPVEQALGHDGPDDRQWAWPRLVAGRPQWWVISARMADESVQLMAMPVGAVLEQATVAPAGAPPARDLLLREVHHRLKNNLQGVSGLLRQRALAHPPAAPWLEDAASQLQAMAQVYSLPLPDGSAPPWVPLVQAVARSVGAVFGVEIPVQVQVQVQVQVPGSNGPAAAFSNSASGLSGTAPNAEAAMLDRLLLTPLDPSAEPEIPPLDAACIHPDQAGAVALVLNELMTNAVKHGQAGGSGGGSGGAEDRPPAARCRLTVEADGHQLEISNAGHWPDGVLGIDRVPSGIQGLGLVKALLPSRGARLELVTSNGLVCARLHIRPPLLWSAERSTAQSTIDYCGAP